jgi:hypothetical protein
MIHCLGEADRSLSVRHQFGMGPGELNLSDGGFSQVFCTTVQPDTPVRTSIQSTNFFRDRHDRGKQIAYLEIRDRKRRDR